MPANDRCPQRVTHHARAATLSAVAAIAVTVALAACGSAAAPAASQRSPVPQPTKTGGPGVLTGAGSTFDAPFFGLAFAHYHQQHPGVTIRYSAVGSSAGIADFTAERADFGASDVPMTATQQATAHGGPSLQIPVDLGAEVVAFNLGLLGPARLRLTGPVIAKIFLGQITHWRSPPITALNPGVYIPNEPITVVHRSDGSGTTYILSNYLSTVSPAWAAMVGTGTTLHWPTGVGAEGNAGVTQTVTDTPYSIGYIERSYAKGPLLPYAAIQNQAGRYTTPTTASISADAAEKPRITATDFSIVNEPGADSYPICGYSWALVYAHQPSPTRGRTLAALLTWLTHAGQKYAVADGYVQLPPQIQQLAQTTIQKLIGPGGTHLR